MPSVPYEIPGFKHSLPAAADLSAGQYHACISSSGNAARAGAGAHLVGVQQNKPAAAGRATELMQTGITKASAGAAVTQDAAVKVDASGQFIDAATTEGAVGFALTGTSGADEIFSLLLADHVVP
ncbi:MAG: DUF2190 family protein [Proteobacteria bacterium]|nr:DUF2190 family protein [Pseudomonadota bacterium]